MQDFRLMRAASRDKGMTELRAQVIAEQIMTDLIQGFAKLKGLDLQGQPGVITTGQMISLGSGASALAFLATGQLLESSMQFFDLPAHVIRLLSDLRGYRLIQVIGHHPVNVTVCGDQLEQPHLEWHCFQFDENAVSQTILSPLDLIEMDVSFSLTQTHQAVVLQGREEDPTTPMQMLEIVDARIPTVEQNRSRLDVLVRDRVLKHLHEMLVFGFAILIRRIHPVVDGVELTRLPIGVNQVHHADALDHPVGVPTPLPLHQLDLLRMLFVLHTVIHNQTRLRAVLYPTSHQLPHLSRLQLRPRQIVADLIVAHPIQMIGQICARPIVRRTDQVFHILFLVDHLSRASFYVFKRKS